MGQYISKSAVVAEIEKRIKNCAKQREDMFDVQCYTLADDASARIGELKCIQDFIDTLEVKEVDLEHLEQEVKDFCYEYDDRKDKWYNMTPHDKNIMVNPTWANFTMSIAKHFFELGLQVRQQ